ncbi:MAG: histidine phosphatase family protein [Myxococcales bacterium]|nr:histidine phosphatase family protein [Myxococcales bacterium]
MITLIDDDPVVLVMVGLPARGKTFLARKLARYLTWLGREARVFNVGNYRRERLGSTQPASFFDPDNLDGFQSRHQLAVDALADLVAWLEAGKGRIAIYDATNATRERRDMVDRSLCERGLTPIFIETVCNDPAQIEANIRESKLSMPDYAGVDPDAAVADFRARIAHYERAYEPMDEVDRSWIRLVDVGERVEIHRLRGSVPTAIVPLLLNQHLMSRPIYLTRHGQSAYNTQHRIGGDSPLTAAGQQFAGRLASFLGERIEGRPVVWTSTLQRTRQTAAPLPWPTRALRNLDEIDGGRFDGWTYDAIEQNAPEDWAARKADKLRYRYPRGESYLDVIQRLDPVIVEIERTRAPLVVVAHQAVIRCLYAFLTDQPMASVPRLPIPLHTVIELVPKAYGAVETRHELGPQPTAQ